MKLFALDLWHDLREKRLWPVAALLLVGLAAVPLVLAKPAAEPAPPPPPAQQDAQTDQNLKGLAKVVLAEDKAANGSKLNLFDSSNPFRPPASALNDDDEDSAGEAPGAGEVGAGGSAPETGAGSPPSSGGDVVGGGGGDGGTNPQPQPQPETKTAQFTYVIDATFKNGEKTRKINGMQRLAMLPNQDSPLLLFLGVDAGANNAVFLVDSRLSAAGEGTCKPNANECSFLYLGAGSQHMFTEEDGTTYTLRIDQIRRVKLGKDGKPVRAKSARRARQDKARGSSRSPRARASVERRPFVPPFLADLVTVTDSYDSSSSTERRR